MSRLIVPKYAKNLAKKALEKRSQLPPSKRFGLEKEEAEKLGIASGVERAKQLIRSKTVSYADAKKIARFSRFKNCHTENCQGAIDLWGGRRFIKKAQNWTKQQ